MFPIIILNLRFIILQSPNIKIMTSQNNNLDLELEIAEKQAQEAAAQHEATCQRLRQLRNEERRLTDPKERQKCLGVQTT